jgi:hypothetical protein
LCFPGINNKGRSFDIRKGISALIGDSSGGTPPKPRMRDLCSELLKTSYLHTAASRASGESDEENWKWMGWLKWHCRFYNQIIYQEFEYPSGEDRLAEVNRDGKVI